MTEDVREQVRQRYAAAARGVDAGDGCCGAADAFAGSVLAGVPVFGGGLYPTGDPGTEAALQASLGCGVPTEVADLHEGDVVLDLGSGAGADVLIAARRVGPTGRVVGLDMTAEMVELARRHVAEAGATNVEIRHGYLEEIPLPDASVDVVISNCVINLTADKQVVLAEAARVTRPGGRFAVSDVVAADDMDETTRADVALQTGCIAGALTEDGFRSALAAAGWREVEIRYTHRVHAQAQAAIIRAVRA
ncbi:arsenite methyltransferase [Desertihabitans aurantiacus]|uniref:arsenite methyltransferase n=1 Tax=Desertihabitans aurantiacus TaxID=2282477 RepID=UPI000DF84DDF|nr:arsenite methyltransferase [Desertihabitans aurantiacus]